MELGEKKIIRIDSQKEIPGFDLITSILLRDNDLNPDDFNKLFPDIFIDKKLTIYDYLTNYFVPLKETETFINFIMENFDKKICLITDYDVDGILSTVILKMGLNYIGMKEENIIYHIPKRIHSYGLSKKLIDRAISNGAEVIITADNGVGAKDAVEYAISKGLKVLVTDHHLPVEENVPVGVPIINPKHNGDKFYGISGANVVFKLIFELIKKYTKIEPQELFIDDILSEMVVYAAIATVSDLMPMLEENRLLVMAAINYINDLKRRGYTDLRIYKFLLSFGGKFALNDPRQLFNEDVIAFSISPCINSISRLGHSVEDTVREIIDNDNYAIYKKNYYGMNKERQIRTKKLAEKHVKTNDPVSIEIVNPEDFDFEIAGLIGLAVNKITAEENKPAFLGSSYVVKDDDGNEILNEKGDKIERYSFSARSTLGYSIHDGVNRVKELAPELEIEGGGHSQAIGISFKKFPGSLELFKKLITEDYLKYKTSKMPVVYEMNLEYVEYALEVFEYFKHFGHGFNKIKFAYTGKLHLIEGQFLLIGDFKFLSYSNTKQYVPGKTYRVIFNINLGYVDSIYFTIAEIKEIED